MSPATDFIDPNLSGTASKAFHLFSTEPTKQFCIGFFLLFGGGGVGLFTDQIFCSFFFNFASILVFVFIFFTTFDNFYSKTCVLNVLQYFLFFVCLIRRKVKLNKHTQSTFMYNHVYLWNIEGVLCVHVNVAQNQSSYG